MSTDTIKQKSVAESKYKLKLDKDESILEKTKSKPKAKLSSSRIGSVASENTTASKNLSEKKKKVLKSVKSDKSSLKTYKSSNSSHRKISTSSNTNRIKTEREKKLDLGFQRHLFTFLYVNLVLIIANVFTFATGYYKDIWFVYVTAVWALTIIAHGFSVYGPEKGLLSKDWSNKKLKDYIKNKK